jgi:CheY-like chemotaxis protein
MVNPFTVLLVDDDDDDIEFFVEVIKTLSDKINIITGKNGIECLQTLENITPDIIFLDVNMPLMDGKECLEKIKSDSALKNIPVVIYSTTRQKEEIEHFINIGATFLQKPVSFADFLTPLKSVLSQHLTI